MSVQTTAPSFQLTFAGVLRSEWIKLRSVRSTWWTYGVLVLASVGLAALVAVSAIIFGGVTSPEIKRLIMISTIGLSVSFAQIVVAAIGVISITTEFHSGMIRATFSAVPRRLPVLFAKAVIVFIASLVAGLVSAVFCYLVSAVIFADFSFLNSYGEADLLRPLLLGPLYLGLISVFALGIGAMLRSSAGAISSIMGLIFAAPIVFALISFDWVRTVEQFLLGAAGQGMTLGNRNTTLNVGGFGVEPLELWQQVLTVLIWTAASLGSAAVVLRVRDA